MDNLILIGYMGSGKTSVGKQLACKYGYEFMDTDECIEKKAGMKISDLFQLHGEENFRRMETQLLKELIGNTQHCIISTGGGMAVRTENVALLKKLGIVIFLRVKKETIISRLEGDTTRPLLAGDELEKKVETMLKIRTPFYEAAADYILDTDDYTIEELVEMIYKNQKKEG